MNSGGEAADQMVREGIQITEAISQERRVWKDS